MALLSELELPILDYADPDLRGPAFHARMPELRAQGWLAATPLGDDRARPRGGRGSSCARRATTFPGTEARRALRHRRAARWPRRCAATSSTSTATTTGACATSSTRPSRRARPTAGGRRCRASWSSSGQAVSADGRCEFVEAVAKPYPSLVDRDRAGRAAGGRAAPARVVQLDPAPVRRRGADGRARRGSSAAVVELYDYPTRCWRPGAGDPGDDLISTLLAAEADGDRLSDVELREPRPQRPHRRHRHHAVPARARHPPARRAPRAVGGAARRPGAGRGGGRGGAALRADHAVHGADRRRGRAGARRRLPGRAPSCWSAACTANRDGLDDPRPLRHHAQPTAAA